MASILDRYGIKEVADVMFYEINDDGTPGNPVLYLDTLKVSTIEQTADNTAARGGKGNPQLISWDFGKEITLSLEDALFSPKSMNIMFGTKGASIAKASGTVSRTVTARLTDTGALPSFITCEVYDSLAGNAKKEVVVGTTASDPQIAWPSYMKLKGVYLEDGTELKAGTSAITSPTLWAAYTAVASNAGKRIFVKYEASANKSTITIDGSHFPGTYYITGDTYARSEATGKDEFFQFIVPKAKMTAENTITLEAEGDPSVFNLNLTVLRPENNEMMKLVQYDLTNAEIE